MTIALRVARLISISGLKGKHQNRVAPRFLGRVRFVTLQPSEQLISVRHGITASAARVGSVRMLLERSALTRIFLYEMGDTRSDQKHGNEN